MMASIHKLIVRGVSWDTIIERFRDDQPATADFVEWLRDSKYAYGLFAVTSHETLVIGQSPEFEFSKDVIRVAEEGDKFRLTYLESNTSTSEREFGQSELIPAFERLLESLHWFADKS